MNNSPPNSLTLFLDATHQSKITEKLLRHLDIRVEILRRHFLPATPDPDWISDVTNRGWVIISGDKGIREDGVNRHAVIKSCAKVFLLSDTESRGAEWAASLVMARHKILKIVAENSGPFYCVVEKGNDHHVRKPEFFEGGGPLPTPSPILESQVSAPDQTHTKTRNADVDAEQRKIPFPAE